LPLCHTHYRVKKFPPHNPAGGGEGTRGKKLWEQYEPTDCANCHEINTLLTPTPATSAPSRGLPAASSGGRTTRGIRLGASARGATPACTRSDAAAYAHPSNDARSTR